MHDAAVHLADTQATCVMRPRKDMEQCAEEEETQLPFVGRIDEEEEDVSKSQSLSELGSAEADEERLRAMGLTRSLASRLTPPHPLRTGYSQHVYWHSPVSRHRSVVDHFCPV